MRCEDVIRELAAPTDTRVAASLADHLNQCESCAAWAERAARLDRLWQMTQPAEPAPEVWENVWAGIVSSLDVQTAEDVVSPAESILRNGTASRSLTEFESKNAEPSRPRWFPSKRWSAVGLVGLAQAAAILLVAGLSWRYFGSPRPAANQVVASLSVVDIEEGHVVMIVADPKNLAVVDLTPKTTIAGIDQSHIDWYGDEGYFDWFQVYHEVESLAKPTVAME
jgi:hypothetical protein